MARLSVAQGPCSAVLQTVHGYHYAFQKFPFFVSPYICNSMYSRLYTIFFRSWLDLCYLFNVLIFVFYVATNGAENGERQFVWK